VSPGEEKSLVAFVADIGRLFADQAQFVGRAAVWIGFGGVPDEGAPDPGQSGGECPPGGAAVRGALQAQGVAPGPSLALRQPEDRDQPGADSFVAVRAEENQGSARGAVAGLGGAAVAARFGSPPGGGGFRAEKRRGRRGVEARAGNRVRRPSASVVAAAPARQMIVSGGGELRIGLHGMRVFAEFPAPCVQGFHFLGIFFGDPCSGCGGITVVVGIRGGFSGEKRAAVRAAESARALGGEDRIEHRDDALVRLQPGFGVARHRAVPDARRRGGIVPTVAGKRQARGVPRSEHVADLQSRVVALREKPRLRIVQKIAFEHPAFRGVADRQRRARTGHAHGAQHDAGRSVEHEARAARRRRAAVQHGGAGARSLEEHRRGGAPAVRRLHADVGGQGVEAGVDADDCAGLEVRGGEQRLDAGHRRRRARAVVGVVSRRGAPAVAGEAGVVDVVEGVRDSGRRAVEGGFREVVHSVAVGIPGVRARALPGFGEVREPVSVRGVPEAVHGQISERIGFPNVAQPIGVRVGDLPERRKIRRGGRRDAERAPASRQIRGMERAGDFPFRPPALPPRDEVRTGAEQAERRRGAPLRNSVQIERRPLDAVFAIDGGHHRPRLDERRGGQVGAVLVEPREIGEPRDFRHVAFGVQRGPEPPGGRLVLLCIEGEDAFLEILRRPGGIEIDPPSPDDGQIVRGGEPQPVAPGHPVDGGVEILDGARGVPLLGLGNPAAHHGAVIGGVGGQRLAVFGDRLPVVFLFVENPGEVVEEGLVARGEGEPRLKFGCGFRELLLRGQALALVEDRRRIGGVQAFRRVEIRLGGGELSEVEACQPPVVEGHRPIGSLGRRNGEMRLRRSEIVVETSGVSLVDLARRLGPPGLCRAGKNKGGANRREQGRGGRFHFSVCGRRFRRRMLQSLFHQ